MPLQPGERNPSETSWVAALRPRKNGAEPAGSGALAAASGRRAGGGTIASRGQANRCAKFTLYFHICFEGENEGCKPKARALEIVQPRCGARSPYVAFQTTLRVRPTPFEEAARAPRGARHPSAGVCRGLAAPAAPLTRRSCSPPLPLCWVEA